MLPAGMKSFFNWVEKLDSDLLCSPKFFSAYHSTCDATDLQEDCDETSPG